MVAEQEARAEAELEAKRREKAAAQQRRDQEKEARRRAEEQAEAEAQAKREAEEHRALGALEVELRGSLEQEARAHAAELRSELERESHAKIEEGLQKARKRMRLTAAGAVVVLLASAAIYGLVLSPRMEGQTLEIERLRQEAHVLQRDKADLEQKVEELGRNLERMEFERKEAAPPSPTQKRSRKRFDGTRDSKRDPLKKPACGENDPLCGI